MNKEQKEDSSSPSKLNVGIVGHGDAHAFHSALLIGHLQSAHSHHIVIVAANNTLEEEIIKRAQQILGEKFAIIPISLLPHDTSEEARVIELTKSLKVTEIIKDKEVIREALKPYGQFKSRQQHKQHGRRW